MLLLREEEGTAFAFGADSDEVCARFQFQWEIILFLLSARWDGFVL